MTNILLKEDIEQESASDIMYLYEKENELWQWWCSCQKEAKIIVDEHNIKNRNSTFQTSSKERIDT
jgi:hypothetical protein